MARFELKVEVRCHGGGIELRTYNGFGSRVVAEKKRPKIIKQLEQEGVGVRVLRYSIRPCRSLTGSKSRSGRRPVGTTLRSHSIGGAFSVVGALEVDRPPPPFR